MSEILLSISGLEVYYDKIRALKNVSLSIYSGEIVTLLGANGAGKSTTLLALMGIVKIRSGTVIYKNTDLRKIRADKIVTKGISLAPEGRHIFPFLSVHENLQTGAVTRKDKEEVKSSLDYVYSLFPRLQERAKQMAGTLSGGEQQMLTIGRALMSSPELLLLDEPSLGISPILRTQIFDAIAEINRNGTTIFLVEQNATAALHLATRAYVMETGSIVLEGTCEELRCDEKIQKAYLGG